jgi:ferritin-like protein
MTDYHEPYEGLPPAARDLHRAIKSLMEELEAVDWYHQRVVSTKDEHLRAILEHNRDEEIEHATMMLEWIRRNMPGWDQQMRRYLFTEAPITEIEDDSEAPAGPGARDLGLGDLRKKGA